MASSGPYKSRRRTNNQGEQAARGRRNNIRTSTIRKSSQYQQTINLVDKLGNKTSKVQEGRMNIASHDSVLAALEHRLNQYKCHRKLGDIGNCTVLAAVAIDKTGTVDASYLLHNNSKNNKQLALIEQQEQNRVRELGVADEALQVHGTPPLSKGKEILRLVYENVNGLSNKVSDNEKVEKAKKIHDELEVDIAAYNKHRLNMQHRRNVNSFNQLFTGGEAAIQLVVSHNIHKDISRVQEGGTSLLLFGRLTDQLDHDQTGKDETGLGRWSVMTLKGDGVMRRVVCGYNPCFNRNLDSSTTYQQHRRFFITQKKDLTCSCTKFREDLVGQLKQWREDGDQLIVCLNANKNIYKKLIGKRVDGHQKAGNEVGGWRVCLTTGWTNLFQGIKANQRRLDNIRYHHLQRVYYASMIRYWRPSHVCNRFQC
jgi:hypothetical protein